jgi:hypothetical protein
MCIAGAKPTPDNVDKGAGAPPNPDGNQNMGNEFASAKSVNDAVSEGWVSDGVASEGVWVWAIDMVGIDAAAAATARARGELEVRPRGRGLKGGIGCDGVSN